MLESSLDDLPIVKELCLVSDALVETSIVEESTLIESLVESSIVEESSLVETLVELSSSIDEASPDELSFTVDEASPVELSIVEESSLVETLVELSYSIEASPDELSSSIEESPDELSSTTVEESPVELSIVEESSLPNSTPKLIFIVPYRDRELQRDFFRSHMKNVLIDMEPSSYEIFFSQQSDNRLFNRGAMKNIGFIAMKQKYPNTYKNITFVFNDVDTMPFTKNFLPYETKNGTIKHFYGFHFALGGIVSVNGGDFEIMNGFPNFWSWGYEDNELQRRANLHEINVDRSVFYPLFDKRIIFLQDGFNRVVDDTEKIRYFFKTTEGLRDITHLQFEIENDVIHVNSFNTATDEKQINPKLIDLRKKPSSVSMKIPMILR